MAKRICPKCGGEYSHLSGTAANGHKAYSCENPDCNYVFWESEIQHATEEVPLDLSDQEFAILAKMAHERDLTFNQLVNNILRDKLMDFEAFIEDLRDEFCLPRVPLDSLSRKDLQDYIKSLEGKLYLSRGQ